MIIGSWDKKEIGKRYFGILDAQKNEQLVPYLILKESSFEDWLLEYERDLGYKLPEWRKNRAKLAHFYKISVD